MTLATYRLQGGTMSEAADLSEHHGPPKFSIHIDRKEFKVEDTTLTGTEIRNLPTPPVPDDRDLFLDVPGKADELVNDGDTVRLKNGMRFFTIPRAINPGQGDAAGT
jgi:hypothetical protein